MGSQPWKRKLMESWDDEFSGRSVVVTHPGAVYSYHGDQLQVEPVTGIYEGSGAYGSRPCVFLHTRPEMSVRDPEYWDHHLTVIVERGMEVDTADA